MSKTIIWWGKGDRDYSRNRIIRQQLIALGHHIIDFEPKFSSIADAQAFFMRLSKAADYIWVPCFRQRDFAAAARYSSAHNIPLIFDPLISAYDKQVYEREKLAVDSAKAKKLQNWESLMMQRADYIIADTAAHKDFFIKELSATAEKVIIIPVSAESELFQAQAPEKAQPEVLFYGSFVQLQGTHVIIEAAKLTPHIKWTLLGEGKLKQSCIDQAKGYANIHFESWIDYSNLPSRIGDASVLLGVFGDTPKAKRVIANKVYQSLACARPVISIATSAYLHPDIGDSYTEKLENTGLLQIENKPTVLSQAILDVFGDDFSYAKSCASALNTYDNYYSQGKVKEQLAFLN